MAVNVSENYRTIIYSGGAINRATLKINDIQIPNSNIKKITISSPIIDKTADYFYIGTFLAQKLDVEFKNATDIDLNGTVTLTIDTLTREPHGEIGDDDYDDGYEIIDIGTYYIDTTPESYYKMAKITCYDKSILFKKNIDISKWFTNNEITAENLLINLCQEFLGNNMLGTYPQLHRTLTTGSYDNTKSGKYYISQIAEIMGCNAKIGRDGKLYLVPLKQVPSVTINALKSKSWELSSKYKISRVYYENGDNIWENGTQDYNSLNIRVDNIFINGDNDHIQGIINSLYNELNGFEMYSAKTENYGDPSLDCWDLINYQLGNENYYVLNDNELVYEMNIASTVNPTFPSKQKAQITNVIGKTDNIINIMKTEIDQVNNRVTQTNERVDVVSDDLSNVYTKTQTEQLIRDSERGLTNIFTNGGGNNLLMNTAPYRKIDDTTLESWQGNITDTEELDSINKKALMLLNDTAYQSVDVTEGYYAIGFKFKRLIDGANLTISYNGREITINSLNEISFNDETNLTKSYTIVDNKIQGEINSFGYVNSSRFTISFTCDVDNAFEIYELRLVKGNITIAWTQNQNELKTTTVNIGDGITIESEQANTINKLDTNGMVVRNKTTEDITLKATDAGIETEDFLSKGKSNVSGMLVQRINSNHIFITGTVEV